MAQSDRTCCGVIKEAQYNTRQRQRNKPQPWIVLKFTVGLSLGILGYVVYVYAGRFCKDMIARNSSALADPATGVAFLVVFSVLLLLVLWSYVSVVITSPGNARDYTEQTERPGYEHRQNINYRPSLNSEDIRGPSYELMAPTVDLSRQLTHETETQSKAGSQKQDSQSSPSGKSRRGASLAASSIAQAERDLGATTAGQGEAHITNVLGVPAVQQVTNNVVLPGHAKPREPSLDLPPPIYSRRPPTTPVLLPEYRYCSKCKIVKPPRAHHCRACGTCVLKYDHHCPWVGHCVGAFNQKYFVNFLQWGTVFCCWTFVTLLVFNVKPRASTLAPALDPQQIIAIALTGLFGLFCSLMLITQLHLILVNETTVESIGSRSMRDRERATLSHMHRWYEFSAKRRTRKHWDDEWGEIGREGNLWWLGSSRANWEAVMGKNIWWWFLPVGRCVDDGMSYPMNPRFDSQGRWKRRKEWPSDLQ